MKWTRCVPEKGFFSESIQSRIATLVFLFLLVLLPNVGSAHQEQTKTDANTVVAGNERGEEANMEGADKLSEAQGKYLLNVARKTIQEALFGGKGVEKGEENLSPIFKEDRGTFVTLTTGGNLRGCIGHIVAQESLLEGIKVNAINAAFRDPRFNPVGKSEWDRVKIEVSILTDPKPLSYTDADDLLKKLRPGIDGVILKKGYCQSTFLPQVWDQLPKKEDFLNHLCLKAGLDANAWRKGDLEVSTYQAQAFEEE